MLAGHETMADAVAYALDHPALALPMGFRNDCMGWKAMDAMTTRPQWELLKERWKTAPVVVEPCNFDRRVGDGDVANWGEALIDAKQYSVSFVGNGNQPDGYDVLSDEEKANWLMTGKVSGYRYELRKLSLPGALRPGTPFAVAAEWGNVGTAPLYEKWNVEYRLVNKATGAVVWRGTSSLDLRKMLPTGETNAAATDTFTVPTSVPAGTYELRVAVTDPTGYYKVPADPAAPSAERAPYLLKLANAGRQADGSYALGDVSVRGL